MRHPPRRFTPILAGLAALVLVVAWPKTARAFDCGYHTDALRDALLLESFDLNAIQVAQITNWYDDGFESAKVIIEGDPLNFTIPTSALGWGDINCPGIAGPLWGGRFGPAPMQDLSDRDMHFDALKDYDAVAHNWDKLVRNTHTAVEQAEAAGDVEGFLAILGMTSHTAQDFYSHSNWAEIDWGGDATWFDISEAQRSAHEIYTHHQHTDGTTGSDVRHDTFNKDWATSPRGMTYFETAYRESYLATYQWVEMVKYWVSDSFWQQARTYVNGSAGDEFEYVRYLCWYSGHWKGPLSKSYHDYLFLAPTYLADAPDEFINKWKQYAPTICGWPDPVTPVPQSIVYPEVTHWAKLNTALVYQTDDDLVWDIDPGGEADFYARIKVNGVEYILPMKEDADLMAPDRDWMVLSPLAATSSWLEVVYDLWDEDCTGDTWVSLRGDEDHCDIKIDLGQKTYVVSDAQSAFVGGRHIDTDGLIRDEGLFASDGDGDEAFVCFTVAVEEPVRVPRNPLIHAGAGGAIPLPPAPVVTDDGAWTTTTSYIHASWAVPEPTGNPPLEYQYRVMKSTEAPPPSYIGGYQRTKPTWSEVVGWTSVGTYPLSRDIVASLVEGSTYYVQVKARNVAGWSAVGSSDGIVVDFTPPVMGSITANLETYTAAGPPAVNYPNSLAIGISAADGGSGIARYMVYVCETTPAQTGEGNLKPASYDVAYAGGLGSGSDVGILAPHPTPRPNYTFTPVFEGDIPPSQLVSGILHAYDLPVRNGRTYEVRVSARDNAGNVGLQTNQTFTVSFSDTTPPPVPTVQLNDTVGRTGNPALIATWSEVHDQESGTVEYWIAAGGHDSTVDAPDLVPWKSVGRKTSYEVPGIDPDDHGLSVTFWVKAVNGMGTEGAVGSALYQTPIGVQIPPEALVSVGLTAPIRVFVLGGLLEMDQAPVVVEGRVMVPMRAIFEAMGAGINWDQNTRTVTAKKGDRTVVLTIGHAVGYVNGAAVQLSAPPAIISGRTLVPLRFVGEALNCLVEWHNAARSVTVVMP